LKRFLLMAKRKDQDAMSTPPPQADISDYPDHVESFETYYWLGENRTLKETALLRFQELVPDCPPTDPRFPSKFESFYTKIKRWAAKENWKEWVKRKELEERTKREGEMREKIIQSQRNIVGYRGILQQGLVGFSRKVSRSTRILNRILQIEEVLARGELPDAARKEAEVELADLREDLRRNGIEIRSYKEAKECIELDLHLGRYLEELPDVTEHGKSRLSEGTAETIDKIMEILRKRAADSVRRSIGDDNREFEEAYQERLGKRRDRSKKAPPSDFSS